MPRQTETLAECFPSPVMKGIRFLEQHCPDWAQKLNAERLNVANAALCPLGQLFGTSEKACRMLGIDNYRDFLLSHGFAACPIGGYEENVAKLNKQWSLHISARKYQRVTTL